jgi:hypothetical protein
MAKRILIDALTHVELGAMIGLAGFVAAVGIGLGVKAGRWIVQA